MFYSATDDVTKIIGRTFVDIESEGCIARGGEFFITEGGHCDILPTMRNETRQRESTRRVYEVGSGTVDTSAIEFFRIQRKYINC